MFLRIIVYSIKKGVTFGLFPLIWNPLYLIRSQTTKLQLEWGQVNFTKFEIKMGVVKRRRKAIRETGFSKCHIKMEQWKFCLSKFWPLHASVVLKALLNKHQLIKINMAYVYIRPEVKKIIQRQWLRLQINLVLGDYMKSAIWWGKFFGTEEEQFFDVRWGYFLVHKIWRAGNDTFDRGWFRFRAVNISGGRMSKFVAIVWDSSRSLEHSVDMISFLWQ